MEKLIRDIKMYSPCNEQEEKDKRSMLDYLQHAKIPFSRKDEVCHFTASSWIVNYDRTKVLMIYHNIYKSWSWTGGHADGETDLLQVALREAIEETGSSSVHPVTEDIFSLETLVVEGHEKRGKYVPCHLHMNVTYLLEADEKDLLQVKPDENSGVAWLEADKLEKYVSEPWMMERIYRKLRNKIK